MKIHTQRQAIWHAAKVFLLVLLILEQTPAQDTQTASVVSGMLTQVLGPEYDAGCIRRWMLGSHWRDAWTTPVHLPLLSLDSLAGGLVPVRCGDGSEAHILELRSHDGRLFRYRLIHRDPATAWRRDIRSAVVTHAMRDQLTTMLPFASAVAAVCDRAAGFPVSVPKRVALSDHPALSPAFLRFAGKAGLLEEESGPPQLPASSAHGRFSGMDTYSVLYLLETNHRHRIDAAAYCRARLMDVLLGDWNRGAEQWMWVSHTERCDIVWTPIPRNREQAFSLFDGVIPSVVERLVRPLQSYDTDTPDLLHLTWTGRHLDRRILSGVTRGEWEEIARSIQARMTDAVLDSALGQLPDNWSLTVRPRLRRMLRQRRDRLIPLATEYYRLLAIVTDVRATEGDDRIDVQRAADGSVAVTVIAPGKRPWYSRRFFPEETREIRIHALAGDDSVVVTGKTKESIDVRIIGGSGEDILVDRSCVEGWFLYGTPIPRPEHSTWFYDDDSVTTVLLGPGSTFDSRETLPPSSTADHYEPLVEDRGSHLRFDPRFTYNSDDGFLVGGGPLFSAYGFRQDPFSWHMALSAAYATGSGNVELQSDLLYNSIMPGVILHVAVFHSELSLARFYGFGNESLRDPEKEDKDFYLVQQELVDVRPSLRFRSSDALTVEMGTAYRYSEVEAGTSSLFRQNPQYGDGPMKYGEIFGSISWDTRDRAWLPLQGTFLQLSGRYYPVILDNRAHFADAMLDLRAYLPLSSSFTLALRSMGRKLWGGYPFFHAAYLGGKSTLRGFSRERFAGDAALLCSAELRAVLGTVRLLFPGEWGLTAFVDAGRVFHQDELSRLLHTGAGGGAWIAILKRRLALNLQVALSSERVAFYVKTGFTF
ncbi:MAG: BamA/TamA family outer membrane protein [Bacteroidetes bacterium]|nr:BamA/TamA family outer membrane protein [Bacteroidota bacterium]